MPDRPRRIPEATVARLPLYYRALVEMAEQRIPTVSSERLAEMAGVNAAKVRKDFSYLGSYGTRGVGYDVEYLLFQISRELGLTQDWPVVIVGIGNLGAALANYRGFSARGFRIVALVDADPAKCGKEVGGLVVEPLPDLPRIVAERERGHRHHRHPGVGRPGGGRTAGQRRSHLGAELRPHRDRRARRASRCARSTCRSSCRSCPSTSSGATKRRGRWRWGVCRERRRPVTAGYPVSLVLTGRRVLVVGGGQLATRRVAELLGAGARVEVVSPTVSQEITAWADQGDVTVVLRPFEAGDVAGAWLCVAATDDPAVNRAVVVAAERELCFVSAAGDGSASSARPMSVLRRGDLEVAVGTSGRAPGAAAWIRRQLATLVGPEYGVLVDFVAEARSEAGPDANWPAALDSGILESIRAGRLDEARRGLRSCLSSSSG